jgi:hypothetical protein
MDNFTVAESEGDFLSAIEPKYKLSVTWGDIKE